MSDLTISDIGTASDPSADTLDVISLADAKLVLNIQSGDTSQDGELQSLITGMSRRFDDLFGPVVLRSVTETHFPDHYGDGRVFLRQAPASRTSATTITSVTEYTSGSAQALTAEAVTNSTSNNFFLDTRLGVVARRSKWRTVPFASQNVVVVYSAGRYANTAAVDKKFKEAAKAYLQTIWESSQGVQGSVTYGPTDDVSVGGSNFALAESRAVLLLHDELQPPSI